MKELEAVNIMLSAIGESPVGDLDSGHPDADSSIVLLTHARRTLLDKAEWLSLEKGITLPATVDGFILVPSNTLKILVKGETDKFTVRGGKLYNLTKHTNIFSTSVTVDIVFDTDFDDLVFVAQNLITLDAAHALQANFVGDDRKLQNLTSRYAIAKAAFTTEELRVNKYNATKSPSVSKILQGVKK